MTTTDRESARQLRDCYERERGVYVATQRRKHSTHGPAARRLETKIGGRECVWLKLARLCANRSIEPSAYIQWHFHRTLLGKLPAPYEFLASRLADEFLAAQRNCRREIEVTFHIQIQQARTHISLAQLHGKRRGRDAWAEVLLDENVPLSALFRFCLACSIGEERFHRIANFYEPAAVRQYRSYRAAYNEVWGQWIPRRLCELSL